MKRREGLEASRRKWTIFSFKIIGRQQKISVVSKCINNFPMTVVLLHCSSFVRAICLSDAD